MNFCPILLKSSNKAIIPNETTIRLNVRVTTSGQRESRFIPKNQHDNPDSPFCITSATGFLLVGYTVSFKCVVLFWPVSMILIDQGIKIWSSSHQNPWSSILKETQRRKEIISSKLYPPSHCSTKSIGWLTAHSYEYLHTIYKVNDYDLSLNF